MKKAFSFAAFYFLIIISAIPLVGCQIHVSLSEASSTKPKTTSSIQTTSIDKPTIASKTYSNSQFNFSVEYPADWDFEEELVGRLVMFAGPFESHYLSNVCITTENFSRYNLDDYCKMKELQYKRKYSDYTKLEEKMFVIDGLPVIIRTFTITVKSQLKISDAYFIKDKTAYTIDYSVSAEAYEKYIDSFNLAISTFNFN